MDPISTPKQNRIEQLIEQELSHLLASAPDSKSTITSMMLSKQAVITSSPLLSNKSLTQEARVGRHLYNNILRILNMYPMALQLSVKHHVNLTQYLSPQSIRTSELESDIHNLEPIILIGPPDKERYRIQHRKEKKAEAAITPTFIWM